MEENIDRLKQEYALLKKCFEDDKQYVWLTPTKKILYYLPPVIFKSNTPYFLIIQIIKKESEEDAMLMTYARGDYGGGVSQAGIGMCNGGAAQGESLEKTLLSLAKEIKACFYVKAKRALAKAFIEEIYID